MKHVRILIFVLLLIVFLFSVFKNISYPLLWHDETETAMFGQRVLQFGYPKVHDGKNTLYFVDLPDKTLAIKRGSDAYVGTQWSHFYVAAVGVAAASRVDDIYVKTAMIRIPFAIIGCIGLAFLIGIIRRLFSKTSDWLSVSILFIAFEVMSVSLQLHMREVRYYSILLFLLSFFAWICIRYSIFNALSYRKYVVLLLVTSLLMLLTFFPAVLVLIIMLIWNSLLKFLPKVVRFQDDQIEITKPTRDDCVALGYGLLPSVFITIVTIPIASFFEYFKISYALSQVTQFSSIMYVDNLMLIIRFLVTYELLLLVIFSRLLSLYVIRTTTIVTRASRFLIILLLVYVCVIARFPYIFQRYIIVIQPLLALVLAMDIVSIGARLTNAKKVIAAAVLILVFVPFAPLKLNLLMNHYYEIVNQYKGPLDYIIPYLKDTFRNTSNLTVATNYDEGAYMYYLGSKVVGGYVQNNLENDIRSKPDIIIRRKGWDDKADLLSNFERKGKFKTVAFDVYDYNFNNIPELPGYWTMTHLFRTKLVDDTTRKSQVEILIRAR